MNCMEAQKLLQPYLNHELSDRQLEAFLDHIESCRDCYEDLELYFAIRETLSDSEETSDESPHQSLKRHLEMSRANLRLRKARTMIERGLVVLGILLVGVLVYFGLTQHRRDMKPAWETEELSEDLSEGESVTQRQDRLSPKEWNTQEGNDE